MAHTFVVLCEIRDTLRLVDVDAVAQAVGAWDANGLRKLGAEMIDFHVDVGSGDLYAEIDLDPDLVSWYMERAMGDGVAVSVHPNAIISWTASGASPALMAMYEITASLLDGAKFVVWDDVGGVRLGWG